MFSCRQELFTDGLNGQGMVPCASDRRALVHVLVNLGHSQCHGLQVVALCGVDACQGPVSAEVRAGLGFSGVPLHTTVAHPDHAQLANEFKLEQGIVFGVGRC